MVLGGVAEEEERMGTEEAHGIDFGIKYSHLVSMVDTAMLSLFLNYMTCQRFCTAGPHDTSYDTSVVTSLSIY
jgi:hypothetical protein